MELFLGTKLFVRDINGKKRAGRVEIIRENTIVFSDGVERFLVNKNEPSLKKFSFPKPSKRLFY